MKIPIRSSLQRNNSGTALLIVIGLLAIMAILMMENQISGCPRCLTKLQRICVSQNFVNWRPNRRTRRYMTLWSMLRLH